MFVEIKTGKTKRLNDNEKRVRAAIEAKRVSYKLLHMPGTVQVEVGNGVAVIEAAPDVPVLPT